MLTPLKSPKMIETIIIATEMVKIDESREISLKCDQPGVVGENESCKDENFIVKIFIAIGLSVNKASSVGANS